MNNIDTYIKRFISFIFLIAGFGFTAFAQHSHTCGTENPVTDPIFEQQVADYVSKKKQRIGSSTNTDNEYSALIMFFNKN